MSSVATAYREALDILGLPQQPLLDLPPQPVLQRPALPPAPMPQEATQPPPTAAPPLSAAQTMAERFRSRYLDKGVVAASVPLPAPQLQAAPSASGSGSPPSAASLARTGRFAAAVASSLALPAAAHVRTLSPPSLLPPPPLPLPLTLRCR